jgi:hypothetical protein
MNPRIEDKDLVPPRAASLMESLRAFGYDLPTALADLADNSLFHGARNIRLGFHWNGGRSRIAISDDGAGMNEATLVDAMRVGSRSPVEVRDEKDLGRFGLGLKTASFSQCRRMTVFTKRGRGAPVVRCWDLDTVMQGNEWRLLREPTAEAASQAEGMLGKSPGTVVVWEKIDRLAECGPVDDDRAEDAFLRHAESVRIHFAMVFHRLMTGTGRVAFHLNGREIQPWDPFLQDESAKPRIPSETLLHKGRRIRVQPHVLPHLSRVDPEVHSKAAGIRGWNAHQGFYIYRNRRMLVDGDWLGLKGWRQEEHYKLARIQIDLPNTLDHEWEIDVTKSKARPPEALREALVRIGEVTRSAAKKVYSHRGAKLLPAEGRERVFLWEQRSRLGKLSYTLNREHPMIRQVSASCGDPKTLGALFRLIEETVPIPLITITDREQPDKTAAPFDHAKSTEVLEVMRAVLSAYAGSGMRPSDALTLLARTEPFQNHPELLQTLSEETNR